MQPKFSLGSLYKDTCNGYSLASDTGFYIKHLNSIDLALIDEYEHEMLSYYKSKGAFSQKDLLEKRVSEGLWSREKEKKIEFLESNIQTMVDKKRKASIESQIDEIEELINGYEKDYMVLAREKSSITNLSSESLTLSAVVEYTIHVSFCKDIATDKKAFELDDVINFSTNELMKVLTDHRVYMDKFSNSNLRNVSVNKNIRTFIKSSKSAESFFGVNGSRLTSNQVKLFEFSKYFSSLLERIEDITEDEKSKPEDIERRFILESNKKEVPVSDTKSKLMDVFNKT